MRFISRIKRFCCRWKSARRFFSLVFISFVTSSCPIKNPLFFTTICAFSTANVIALNAAYVSRNFSLRLISFSLLAFSFLDQILSLFVFFFLFVFWISVFFYVLCDGLLALSILCYFFAKVRISLIGDRILIESGSWGFIICSFL